jgi:hypothetical protein
VLAWRTHFAANAHDGFWHLSSVPERRIKVCYSGYSGRWHAVVWLTIEYTTLAVSNRSQPGTNSLAHDVSSPIGSAALATDEDARFGRRRRWLGHLCHMP